MGLQAQSTCGKDTPWRSVRRSHASRRRIGLYRKKNPEETPLTTDMEASAQRPGDQFADRMPAAEESACTERKIPRKRHLPPIWKAAAAPAPKAPPAPCAGVAHLRGTTQKASRIRQITANKGRRRAGPESAACPLRRRGTSTGHHPEGQPDSSERNRGSKAAIQRASGGKRSGHGILCQTSHSLTTPTSTVRNRGSKAAIQRASGGKRSGHGILCQTSHSLTTPHYAPPSTEVVVGPLPVSSPRSIGLRRLAWAPLTTTTTLRTTKHRGRRWPVASQQPAIDRP